MKFELNINMDNAAFTEFPESELERCLDDVSRKVVNGETYSSVMDINGNNVGKWEIFVD